MADSFGTCSLQDVLPALGDYFINAIMPVDVLKWRDAQDAKSGTVNTRLRVLRTLLADAASDLDLPRNPAQRTHAVRDRRDREADPNTLSAEQLAKVLGYLCKHEPAWHPLFLALALTGARFGEVSALHWDDIDTRANVIPAHVQQPAAPGRIRRGRSLHDGPRHGAHDRPLLARLALGETRCARKRASVAHGATGAQRRVLNLD